jgi:hypothetical protein
MGSITPAKEGYSFEPERRIYQPMKESQDGVDFKATMLTYRISGDVGLEGVFMQGLPGDPITDARGFYTATVPHGWTGTVTPTKPGCSFHPPSRMYRGVNADSEGHRYEVVSLRAVTPPSFTGDSSQVLVIPTSDVDPKVVVQIKEDMQVMLEILREQLSERQRSQWGLPDYGDFFSSGQSSEAVYLEDYGLVFVMKVDFPLSSLPEEPAAPKPGEEVDLVWQRAREKLRAPSGRSAYGRGGGSSRSEVMSLEKFQTELIKTLRHTANIRHVQNSSKIILTVISQDAGGVSYGYGGGGATYGGGAGVGYGVGVYEGGSSSVSRGRIGPGGGSTSSSSRVYSRGGVRGRTGFPGGRGVGRAAATSVLIIRTSKAGVDSYVSGEIGFEEFHQAATIISY